MLKPEFNIVIPARFSSSRFPGKPLADILGKPMIWHVYQRALEAGAQEIVIATDDERVKAVALEFGASVSMTSPDCESGTDRIVEVCKAYGWDDDTIVVNLQGDEPLTPFSVIIQVVNNLNKNACASIATLCCELTSYEDFHNPNVVKVVTNMAGFAMYFSRAPIPWPRDTVNEPPENVFRHIGIYAYRAGFLNTWNSLTTSVLEFQEKLEQLRAMDHGVLIHVDKIQEAPPHGVDTPEQLSQIINIMKNDPIFKDHYV